VGLGRAVVDFRVLASGRDLETVVTPQNIAGLAYGCRPARFAKDSPAMPQSKRPLRKTLVPGGIYHEVTDSSLPTGRLDLEGEEIKFSPMWASR